MNKDTVKRAINYMRNNRTQFLDSCIKRLSFLPDRLYLSIRYRCLMGKWINWKDPVTFTEKIQWLKVYDYKPEYTQLVDKLGVKTYVANKIGDKYVIPTISEWDNVTDIDFDRLPNKFVLKTSHGGGGQGVVVCSNNLCFDRNKAIAKLSKSMCQSIGKSLKERPYERVKKRIFAEINIVPEGKDELKDYKFFCFNGEVKFFKIDFGRFVEHHANYYDINGNFLPFGELDCCPDKNHIEQIPDNLNEMIRLAECLSIGFKFIRVDLYNINGRIYFGELTFYPASGFGKFIPGEWDKRIGDYLNLR